MALLELQDVQVDYRRGRRVTRAVNGVSLRVNAGETVALVGESGCGKTTVARSILGLQPYSGSIALGGRKVNGLKRGQAQDVGVVWQDPFASLDPRWQVGHLIEEPATVVGKTIDLPALMERCGLSPTFAKRYPHQLSGGQRQRVAIARALALEPALVICDEPTSALDLSVQAQILNLLNDLQKEIQCAYLYISHDLATVRYLSDRIAVMYLGRIVEEGPTEEVFTQPKHPYTRLLIESALTAESIGQLPGGDEGELREVPESGCPFAPRCPRVQADCLTAVPPLVGEYSKVACVHPLLSSN